MKKVFLIVFPLLTLILFWLQDWEHALVYLIGLLMGVFVFSEFLQKKGDSK